ncbi:phage tail tape measure protein [Helicobacter anatolicus]|uniref:phage tail tape measure protein n=1 Tax=Helicobacter anatolicus TaxID=2905874 RepID=UPI001E2DE435|nr:phage tail tape measure protein [Helicobacter anatolicus]MCE3038007.1 phage tail tape measure protein [Helicobacter anatolicus]
MQTQVKLEVIPEFKKLSDTINKINKQVSGISKGISRDIENATKALSNSINRPIEETRKVKREIAQATRFKLKLDVEEACNQVAKLKYQILGAIGGFLAFKKPITSAMDFESAFAMVKKVVDLTKEESRQLQHEIWKMTKEVPLSAKELTEIMASGGQLGLEKNILAPFSDVVAKMAFAFDINAKQAGETIAGIMQKLDIGIDKVRELGDTMNYLGNNTAALPKEIAEILGRTGGLVKTMKLSAEEGIALSASFANMKIPAEQSATAINKMLSVLGGIEVLTPKAQNALESLGFDQEELKEAILDNGFQAIREVLGAIANADDGDKIGLLKNIFGEEAGPKIAQITSNLAKFDEIYKKTMDKKSQKGSMENEVRTLANTTEGAMKRMQSSLNRLSVAIGDIFLPLVNKLFNTLEKIISKLTEFVENHKSLVKVIGLAIASIGGLKIISLVLPLFKAFASCVILPIKMLGTFCNQAELARIGSLALKIPLNIMKQGFQLLIAPIKATGNGLLFLSKGFKLLRYPIQFTAIGLSRLMPSFIQTRIRSVLLSASIFKLRIQLLKIPNVAKIAGLSLKKLGVIGTWVGFAFKGMAKMIKSALVSTGIGAFYIILGEVFAYVYENWDRVVEWIGIGVDKMMGFLSPFFNFVKKTFNAITSPISTILEKLGVLRKELTLPLGEIKINQTQKQVFTQPSLIEQVKQRQMELRENHHTQKQIIDNKTIQIYTNAGAQEVQRAIRSNSYTYADLED